MRKKYNLLLKNNNIYNCNIKSLIKYNPKLVVLDNNDKELYCCDNIQSLYLYPLSIVDYIDNLYSKEILFINIIEIDTDVNYKEFFSNEKFKSIEAVEILIQDDYNEYEINKICEIIRYLSSKKILISLNIKNLNKMPDSMIKYLKYITYFKIFLDGNISERNYSIFLDKLLLISSNSSKKSLLHIKTYLNLEQINLYEKIINDFSKMNVDIFQVSKELIPLNSDNINVKKEYQDIIRNLEKKYNTYDKCKFISVKNISTLYYPRFELDERNSRICYASRMKPYLYNDKLIPCKVRKILSNISEWNLNYNNCNEFNEVLNKCGLECDDCASMFENDLLYNIENIITKYEYSIILKEQ